MAKVIYRVLLIIAAILIIFFLGAMIDIANPGRWLLVTVVATVILIVGYILGENSKNDYLDQDEEE